MQLRSAALIAALAGGSPASWAATSNVDVYGVFYFSVDYVSGVYSSAQDQGSPFSPPSFAPQRQSTTSAGATAAISTSGYLAAARTELGANHAFVRADDFPNGAIGTSGVSRWADAFTINGGSGQGTMQFTVKLRGVVDAGQFTGGIGYSLFANTAAPGDLAGFDSSGWAKPVSYAIAVTPYSAASAAAVSGGPDSSPVPPASPPPASQPDMTLYPGAGQLVDLTLTGSFDFTYGQTYHLVSELGAGVIGGFVPFGPPAPTGTGPTTLDFLDGAFLSGILLPAGASAVFASGTSYSVASVPEPAEWAMLAAGLALVGWRARGRA